MKAAFRSRYGQPEVLTIKEIDKPVPGDNEVLIRVHAATVSRTDCHVLWGLPLFMRLFTGLFKPRLATTGTDFAGEIVLTGKNVKSYHPGDKVIGFEFLGLRSHAEYLTVPESQEMVPVPTNMSWEEAAACVEGAFYALNVVQLMKPQRGQAALVLGATGAIGSATLQFFKYYGASVTATCRGEHAEVVKSLGADQVIDYLKEDFTKGAGRYDFVVDAVGKYSFRKCKRLLKEKGLYSTSGFPEVLLLLLTSISGGKRILFAPPKNLGACLRFTKELAEQGKFKPLIDKLLPLEKVAEAFEYVGTGQKVGNVVIRMSS